MTQEEMNELLYVFRDIDRTARRIAESLEKLTPQLEWLRKHELFAGGHSALDATERTGPEENANGGQA